MSDRNPEVRRVSSLWRTRVYVTIVLFPRAERSFAIDHAHVARCLTVGEQSIWKANWGQVGVSVLKPQCSTSNSQYTSTSPWVSVIPSRVRVSSLLLVCAFLMGLKKLRTYGILAASVGTITSMAPVSRKDPRSVASTA